MVVTGLSMTQQLLQLRQIQVQGVVVVETVDLEEQLPKEVVAV